MISYEELEELMHEAIGNEPLSVCEEHGIKADAVGRFCAEGAMASLNRCGLQPGTRLHEMVGQAMTTLAVCAFEIALRAKELADE